MKTIVLISCVSQKENTAVEAEKMYKSPLFRKSLAYAKKLVTDDAIYILSAKHHLLPLDKVIEPYNETLNKIRKEDRTAWGVKVIEQLREVVNLQEDKFIILAGEKYIEPIKDCLTNIELPLKGMRIGQRLQYLTFENQNLNSMQKSLTLRLHELFNLLERFDYKSLFDPEKNKRIPKKGVYIFFEKGEKISIPNGEKLDRIVRIGTHYNQEGLQERLKNHFTTSNSVFRENVKEALVKRYGNKITNEFINNYMRENFSFVILEIKEGGKEKRRKWEYKLTQTISKAVFLGEIIPSEKWLGKDAAFDEIIEGGLWQKEGIYNEFTSQDIIELRSILQYPLLS